MADGNPGSIQQMTSRGTRHRTIRVHDDLWLAAQAIAAGRGETVSDVVRRSLQRYVKRG